MFVNNERFYVINTVSCVYKRWNNRAEIFEDENLKIAFIAAIFVLPPRFFYGGQPDKIIPYVLKNGCFKF